jgi:hypothetical protein
MAVWKEWARFPFSKTYIWKIVTKIILYTKGGVTRATKLLQLATKSDFNAC